MQPHLNWTAYKSQQTLGDLQPHSHKNHKVIPQISPKVQLRHLSPRVAQGHNAA